MLEITIPGFGELKLKHLVLDYNGTLAMDGGLTEGVTTHLNALAELLQIHVITGDTFGKAKNELVGVNCQLTILPPENQTIAKTNYVQQLQPQHVVAIGNGRNDQEMLKLAALGIAVVGGEGAATQTAVAADILTPHIFTALDLLQHPRRLMATLRS